MTNRKIYCWFHQGFFLRKLKLKKKVPNLNFLTRVTSNFIEIFFFWKNWYYASLESAKHVLSEYAIKCYFAGFTRASFRENWMWIKKSAQPQLFAMAHLQFSQNSFFQKTDIMHYWRALSMGLVNKQSNVLLLVLPGLHSEKIECEFKKVPNPNFLPWFNSNFLKFHFFKKLILGVIGKLQASALRLVNQKIYSGIPQGFILPD